MTAQGRRGLTGQGVVDFLADAIRSGRFAPGQRLVEADLTRELGVSRGPVREAFRRLAAEGLIEIVPNRGALVRRLSATEAHELFEIRTELEALAARRAATNMAIQGVRERFEAEIAPIWDTAPRLSSAAYIAENQRFHMAIVTASGSSQLVELIWRLQLTLILAQIGPAMSSEMIASSLREHRLIAGAIRARDPAAAEQAMREHLGRAMASLRSMPAELFRRER